MNDALSRAYLAEALELLASYLFSRGVELTPLAVGVREAGDETTHFLRELEARHALAAAMRLRELLQSLERSASSTSQLERDQSKGIIRGRLDIPRYIARRAAQRFGPRTYPTIITETSPDTPENALVATALRSLGNQLGQSAFARSAHAEGEATAEAYGWVRARRRRLPWAGVRRRDVLSRLEREAAQRVRKRQTGNDVAYGALLTWVAEWIVDVRRLGVSELDRVVDGILAFPQGEAFWNKVFEVWCLREIASSLRRCGAMLVKGPRPLHERHRGPIYRFAFREHDVDVWFQRQEPLGSARWRYEGADDLVGVPDIAVSGAARPPLLVDAKRRLGREDSQSEEIYKLLGYAENFREAYAEDGFRGVLIFPGSGSPRRLRGPGDAALGVVFIDPEGAGRTAGAAALDGELRSWLDLTARAP